MFFVMFNVIFKCLLMRSWGGTNQDNFYKFRYGLYDGIWRKDRQCLCSLTKYNEEIKYLRVTNSQRRRTIYVDVDNGGDR